jgi:sterol desaturase/sphingolipid hydroxylase (fatty acid hydroxylase superfamily)
MLGISWIYLVVIGTEIILSNVQHKKVYTFKETLHNICISLINGGLDLAVRGLYLIILTFMFRYRIAAIDNSFLYWLLLFIAIDFQFYWMHRLEHFSRLFWAVHVTHHSAENFNVTVGFRASVLRPLYQFIFFIPLALLGWQPIDILLMYSVAQFWAFFVHTETINKLGILEYVFVTPSHHRVHHASNPLYLDRNMGMVLIVWDKLFGTFQKELSEEEYEPIRYGLTKPLEDASLSNIILHEWRNLWRDLQRADIGMNEKIGYMLRPPGWSHDGSQQTSEQLRKEMTDRRTSFVTNKRVAPEPGGSEFGELRQQSR